MRGERQFRWVQACLLLAALGIGALPSRSAENAVARRRPHSPQDLQESPSYFRADSTAVLIHAAITDPKGRFVTGLQKDNFRLFEENTEQQIRYFSTEEAPISVGLVLDFSNSMAAKFDHLQQAVAQFLKTANPHDEFCLIEFRDRAQMSLGFTDFIEEVQNQVAMARPGGSTALLDAVYLGLRQMRKAQHARKALLVVSDGGDNHSRFRPREVLSLARESDVEIYAIAIGDRGIELGDSEGSFGPSLLAELSEPGGGRFYRVRDIRDLPPAVENIGRELRYEYVLGYVSTNKQHDGKYRHVQLKTVRPPGEPRLRAYWKRGYYAPID